MTNIGNPNYPYADVQIPQLADSANIQSALKIYHYGSDTSSPDSQSTSFKNSIAGLIKALYDGKVNSNPTLLNDTDSLDSKISTGFYAQNTDAYAKASLKYPDDNGEYYAGMLTVSATSDGLVYQTYHMSSRNLIFFRTGVRSGVSEPYTWTWNSPWKKITDSTHQHNDLYYVKAEVNAALSTKSTTSFTNHKTFIQQAEPTTGMKAGDLWFW